MASTTNSAMCLRCIRQALSAVDRAERKVPRIARASFSSTSQLYRGALPKKKQTGQAMNAGQAAFAKNRKGGKAVTSAGRPPAPGERRATRKRVVLSSTNALPVAGLRALDKQNVDKLVSFEGSVVAFGETMDALRAVEGFKPTQGWSVYHRPSTVVRPETVRLAGLLKRAERAGSPEERTSPIILYGERGSGKSVLQLQTLAVAQLKGWVIVHIPEGRDVVMGHTAYQPLQRADGTTVYIQPRYVASLLDKILKANEKILASMQLAHKHVFKVPVQDNISMSRLLALGASDVDSAYPIWQAFLKEMTTPTSEAQGLQRPPMIMTFDGFGSTMCDSGYLDARSKPIHGQDLAVVQDFVHLLTGKTQMGNGGVILASNSAAEQLHTPTFNYLMEREVAKEVRAVEPYWDVFKALDAKVEAAVKDVEVMKVGAIGRSEAKGLMEYYALSGLLRGEVTDSLVGEKLTVSGGGMIGAIEKGCVLQHV